MALTYFTYFINFINLLANMPPCVNKELLMQNKNELLKYLSNLGESKEFDSKECYEILKNIPESYFEKINLNNTNDQKEFLKNIFITLKEKWEDFQIS